MKPKHNLKLANSIALALEQWLLILNSNPRYLPNMFLKCPQGTANWKPKYLYNFVKITNTANQAEKQHFKASVQCHTRILYLNFWCHILLIGTEFLEPVTVKFNMWRVHRGQIKMMRWTYFQVRSEVRRLHTVQYTAWRTYFTLCIFCEEYGVDFAELMFFVFYFSVN